MSFDYTIRSGDKLLRCGYTTGTCAALATLGAVRLLLGLKPDVLSVVVPEGITVTVEPNTLLLKEDSAICGIKKYAGDDIDVTADLEICVEARLLPQNEDNVQIFGGEGIGVVTLPGLDRPVGDAAINTVPRKMITDAAKKAFAEANYSGGVSVTVFAPGGKNAAEHTFNPRLGIEGGISILGTGGLVRPQSLDALKESINVEIRQKAALGYRTLLLIPGNYGRDYVEADANLSKMPAVICSNFIGEALDEAGICGFEHVLIVGHIGKLVKLAGGIMDTHSRTADCRAELFAVHAALCGANQKLVESLMQSATADACISLLKEVDLQSQVLDSLLQKIDFHLSHRAAGKFQCGAVLFSLRHGPLGMTKTAEMILGGKNI